MKNKTKVCTTIQELPESERPYEKFEALGPEHLSDVELLAIILQSGTVGKTSLELAKDIIYQNGPHATLADMHRWSGPQLQKIRGVGRVKSLQILSICELGKRLAKSDARKGLSFTSPKSIAKFFMEDMRHLTREHMKLLLLDSRSQLINESTISKGTVNGTCISPRELMVEALRHEAVGMILLHNHPSGNPDPSQEDIDFTTRVKLAGELVGIDLLDHIIIGNNMYVSFVESGKLKRI